MLVTLGPLPASLDPKHLSKKKRPWHTINEVSFAKKVEMIMPEEMYEVLWDKVEEDLSKMRYASVILKLQEVLEGDFLSEYVKKGK